MPREPAGLGRRLAGRLPPAGVPIGPGPLADALRGRAPAQALRAGLVQRLGVPDVQLHASGREALRSLLAHLAARTGRDEVVVPAYTCFSIPAAVVAAGLRVRLVDVDRTGRIDRASLAGLPLERALAVVVCNLFGVPEPVSPVQALAAAAGVALVDDAAQSLGADAQEGPAGGRGAFGLLSFGRGKPLSALGGGALVCRHEGPPAPPLPRGAGRSRALARALVWNLALRPSVFAALAGIPALAIGETRFEPAFARGPIAPAAAALAAALLPRLEAQRQQRAREALRLAAALRSAGRFQPLLASPPEAGAYPRLAVLAPSAAARDRALERLATLGAGASALYPSALDAVPALGPHRAGRGATPGATELAARLLTLPVHGGLRGHRLERVLESLTGL